MRPLRFLSVASVFLMIVCLLCGAARAGAAPEGIPTSALGDLKDSNQNFPDTPVGQTSTIHCLGLCFRQPSSPNGTCDASGTESLDQNVSPPFSAGNYRRGSSSACGGTPVSLPVSLAAGQALWFDASFSPTQQGSFSDDLVISGFTYAFTGSTGAASGVCIPDSKTLCLNNNRFRVTATWQTPAGSSGDANVVPLTSDTGYLWFFNSANVETVVKVLNGCGVNNHYWVFAGGLTNVKTTIRVTDTTTGSVRTYLNPQNVAFQPIQDTGAFASCSPAPGTGDIAFRLRWSGTADLDLHVQEPNGTEIWYGSRGPTSTGGRLDVDANAGCGSVEPAPLENVFWPQGSAPHGTYTYWVADYSNCLESGAQAYTLEVLLGNTVVLTKTGTVSSQSTHFTYSF